MYQPKDIFPLTLEETIYPQTKVNTTGLEEETLDHLNEIISCIVIDNETKGKINNESNETNRGHNVNGFKIEDILNNIVTI